jgi:uncharacterized protein (DUF58 family)
MSARAAVALGLGFLLTGLLFGTDSLLLVGIALAALAGAAVAWVRLAAAGARLLRFAGPATVVEGEPYPLRLELEGGRLPPPGGLLVEPLLGQPVPTGIGCRGLEREVSFPRRGCREVGRAELRIRDPFGLHERPVLGPDAGELLVLPRTEPIRLAHGGAGGRSLGLGDHGSGGSGPDSWAAEFEIDGLRPYRDGTPASRIHWPTVARTRELHERRLSAGADAARVVVLDPLNPESEEGLDRAVRAAASLCLELARAGGCTMLVGGEPLPLEVDSRLRAWDRVHARLARVEAGAGPPPLNRLGRAGVAFVVSADRTARPAHALRRLPAAARVLVAPCEGAVPKGALFTVAGCAGSRIGRVRGLERVATRAPQ